MKDYKDLTIGELLEGGAHVEINHYGVNTKTEAKLKLAPFIEVNAMEHITGGEATTWLRINGDKLKVLAVYEEDK